MLRKYEFFDAVAHLFRVSSLSTSENFWRAGLLHTEGDSISILSV